LKKVCYKICDSGPLR